MKSMVHNSEEKYKIMYQLIKSQEPSINILILYNNSIKENHMKCEVQLYVAGRFLPRVYRKLYEARQVARNPNARVVSVNQILIIRNLSYYIPILTNPKVGQPLDITKDGSGQQFRQMVEICHIHDGIIEHF